MIEIYDNGGKTIDRYTIIIGGDAYGMSSNPLSPAGFNQYIGSAAALDIESLGEKAENIPVEVAIAMCNRMTSDDSFKLKAITAIKDAGEAQGIAQEWQNWASDQALSYGELAAYQDYFKKLAEKFDLVEEFEENAII